MNDKLDLQQTIGNSRVLVSKISDDPYSYYYDRFYTDDEFEIKVDHEKANVVKVDSIKQILREQFVDGKTHRLEWVYNAMKQDPGFMIDPVNNYYKKLLEQSGIDFSALSDDEAKEIIAAIDPVTWGEKYLLQKHGGWKPRCSNDGFPYQAQMIRCKSKKITARAGRRIGKTVSLVVRILHKAYTWVDTTGKKPDFKIVIFTPNQAQIDLIFRMMDIFIDNNPVLMEGIIPSAQGVKIPQKKSPYYYIEFKSGVKISGFVSGSTGIRGQAADMLVMDEASFLTPDDTDAVGALLLENKQVEMWVSSTPKGLKDWFYERVHDPEYVSFHFPTDKFHPGWDAQLEAQFKRQLTNSGYKHEVLADFSADGEGVFQSPYIEATKRDYTYKGIVRDKKCTYGLGCDWNSAANGTQIKVIEYNPDTFRYRIVDSMAIHIEGWTQIKAVEAIRDANRKWRPKFIYVDDGYGATQLELLHALGAAAEPGSADRFLTEAKAVNFSSKIEVWDQHTQQKVKKPAKPFLVNNAVRVVENGLIDISREDEMLIKQMEGYVLDGVSPSNVPRYKADPKHGDHELDAMMIALLGFTIEFSSLGNPIASSAVSMVSQIFQKSNGNVNQLDPHIQARDAALQRDKAREAMELADATRVKGIFTQPATKIRPRTMPAVRGSYQKTKIQPRSRKW